MTHSSSTSADPKVSQTVADSEQTALAIRPQDQQMPSVTPEVVIEIPAPTNRYRRFTWLGAGIALLFVALIAFWSFVMRPQRAANTSLRATVEVLLATQRTGEPGRLVTDSSLQATVEALEVLVAAQQEERPAQLPQAIESEADRNTLSTRGEAEPVPDRSPDVFGRPNENINLRAGPSAKDFVLGMIPSDTRLRLLCHSKDKLWYSILTEEAAPRKGWVAARFVLLSGDPSPLHVCSPLLVQNLCAVEGTFRLLEPEDAQAVNEQAMFRWHFSGHLPASCGFEVNIWRTNEPRQRAHDPVFDHRQGNVQPRLQNEYQLKITNLHDLPSVRKRVGEYNWSVSIVQIDPMYQPTDRSTQPSHFYLMGRVDDSPISGE